jgi:hypothetical protein
MEAYLAVVVGECRVELVGPMDPAAIHDHHDLFASFTKDLHDLMEILAQFLGIKVGHDFIEDFRGPILDRTDDAQQDATGDATPRAIADPRLAFERLLAVDLTLAQRAEREARALGGAPPARAKQGKAPQDGLVCIEQNDLAPARLVFEGGKFECAVSELSRGGI